MVNFKVTFHSAGWDDRDALIFDQRDISTHVSMIGRNWSYEKKLANYFKLEVCYVCEGERGGLGKCPNSICLIIMITIVKILMMILERA